MTLVMMLSSLMISAFDEGQRREDPAISGDAADIAQRHYQELLGWAEGYAVDFDEVITVRCNGASVRQDTAPTNPKVNQ